MTINDMKQLVLQEIENAYKSMKIFENDKNPQVKELYFTSKGQFDILDDLHYKLFKKYYSVNKL